MRVDGGARAAAAAAASPPRPEVKEGRKELRPAASAAAMAFTLYSLLQAALLFVNAIAVLHEERFLRRIGWGTDQGIGGFGEEPGIKGQLMNLIRSVRTVMRVPLIGVNTITIVLLLLFG